MNLYVLCYNVYNKLKKVHQDFSDRQSSKNHKKRHKQVVEAWVELQFRYLIY